MNNETDPLAQFGLDAIELRWTMKDIAGKRWEMINQAHLAKLIELDFVEMREDRPVLTIAGQNTVWEGGKMTARWLFTTDGAASYYQDGDYIYSQNGDCKFSVSAGWWQNVKTGKAEFYVADDWVYSVEGKPAFYFG